ncbi:MAG: hypothetical protein ACRDPJ_04380 [Nocardioidaceae bacterium]
MRREELKERVVERWAVTGHEGKSGALLERVRLDDGRRLVVKRLSPENDLLMAMTGDAVGREFVLWSEGVLDRLPAGVAHAVVGGWAEPEGSVLVMRDLGDSVLTWADRLDPARCRWMLRRMARMHDTFAGADLPDAAAAGLTPLPVHVGLFSPDRVRPFAESQNGLPAIVLRGWDIFFETVPNDVAAPVRELLDDPSPLVAALESRPVTLLHGDLTTVNMAVEGDRLTLLDWALPALAPGAVDIARFLAGCSSVVDLSREEVLAVYRDACGPSYDDYAMGLALVSGLLWLGWNKAYDAAEHPDAGIRARERDDLDWWLRQARRTLDAGLL